MAVSPLVPYTDLVTTGSETVEASNASTVTPVGIESTVDPFVPRIMPNATWQAMDPATQAAYIAEMVTGGEVEDDDDEDDNEGNFNPGAGLDISQVMPPTIPDIRTPGLPANPPTSQPGPNGLLSATAPLEDYEPESRADDIGYRYSEFVKGLGQRLNHVFGLDEGGDAGREHFLNAWDPDRNNAPELPISEAAIGMPTGSYAKEAGIPQAVMAPTGDAGSPQSLYSPDPNNWEYVSDDADSVKRILSVAQSMIAQSANPGDLVRQAYAAAGVEVPDMIDFQLEEGVRVPLNELKPGDLIGWSDNPDSPFRDNVGIMLMDGMVIRDSRVGEGVRVYNVADLPKRNLYGVRISHPKRDRAQSGGVSLNAREARQSYADIVNGINDVLGGIFGDVSPRNKKSNKSKSKGRGKSKSKGGNRDKGSKFYGSEKKDSGNSSKKYSGIGATK